MHCQFSARNGSDALFLEKFYFNKMLIAQYSSATGKYTGYTDATKRYAEDANNHPAIMEQQRKNCYNNCFSRVSAGYDVLKVTGGYMSQVVTYSQLNAQGLRAVALGTK